MVEHSRLDQVKILEALLSFNFLRQESMVESNGRWTIVYVCQVTIKIHEYNIQRSDVGTGSSTQGK